MHKCMCMNACLSLSHTRASTCRDHWHTLESCGGDECDADSFSLLTRACACIRAYLFPFLSVKRQADLCLTNVYERLCFLFVHFYEHARQLLPHTIIHTYICVCIFICCLFAFLSIPDSCLPNSLFLLDTGILCCPTTSCRPSQPALLRGFHRLREFACFSWLFTQYCA